MYELDLESKGWLPEGVSAGDLPDSAFAWLSDAYVAGKESKTEGRKLPFMGPDGKVNPDGWRAAWSRAHQDGTDFDGGPTQDAVIATLLKHKPTGIDAAGKDHGALQHKTFSHPELKFFGSDDGPGSIDGYLAWFNNTDRGKEMVLPGAFAKSLPDFVSKGFLTISHNWDVLPIATITDAAEDSKGLAFKGEFHSTSAAQDARKVAQERLARGKTVSTSIGYTVVDGERKGGILHLKELNLFEGSMVPVPMNPMPTITAVKGLSEEDPASWCLPAGLTYQDQVNAVLAAVADTITRSKAIADLRVKEGKVLSAANVDRIRSMGDSLMEHAQALHDLAASANAKPAAATAAKHAALAEYARHLYIEAQRLGVQLPS